MPLEKNRTFFAKTITIEDIKAFIDITGDDNPIHSDVSDPEVSKVKDKLGIKKECAHGPLITSLICKPILELGGSGTVLLETGPYTYLRPVEVGDSVSVECRMIDVLGGGKYKISIRAKNQDDEKIIEDTYAFILVLEE